MATSEQARYALIDCGDLFTRFHDAGHSSLVEWYSTTRGDSPFLVGHWHVHQLLKLSHALQWTSDLSTEQSWPVGQVCPRALRPAKHIAWDHVQGHEAGYGIATRIHPPASWKCAKNIYLHHHIPVIYLLCSNSEASLSLHSSVNANYWAHCLFLIRCLVSSYNLASVEIKWTSTVTYYKYDVLTIRKIFNSPLVSEK